MKNAKLTILIVIIVLVIGAISFYIWNEFQDRNSGIDEKMAVSIPLKENPAAREPKAIVKVEKKLPPMPDLNKPIKITAKIDDKAKKEAIEIINNLRKDLKENNDLYNSWLGLGLRMKFIGDYKEAEKIWLYTAAKWDDATPVSNLSNLYIYELNDLKKGEEYMLRAIDRAPFLSLYYYNAYEFYRFIAKEPKKAKEILRVGIKAKNIDNVKYLTELLNSF